MSETRQLVIFSLAHEEHGQPRSVASSAPWIRGVINLRGKIVPVCDLPCGSGSPTSTPRTRRSQGVAKLDQRLPILLNPDGLLAGITLAV